MKKLAIYAGLLAVLATPVAALAGTEAQSSNTDAKAVRITGQVSCARFGRGSVTARKGMSVAQTIQYCVNFQHSEYTLVAGNQIFRLTGDANLLAKMSGQTVTVDGHLFREEPDVTQYALVNRVEVTNVVPSKD